MILNLILVALTGAVLWAIPAYLFSRLIYPEEE